MERSIHQLLHLGFVDYNLAKFGEHCQELVGIYKIISSEAIPMLLVL